jgi:hypothetical protein
MSAVSVSDGWSELNWRTASGTLPPMGGRGLGLARRRYSEVAVRP